VTVNYVDYAPGRVGAPHRHSGFVLVYVLEGTVIAKISEQGEEKTYTAGQMFYEQPGATHEVSKNGSQTKPARLLAMIFAKKGGDADHARLRPRRVHGPVGADVFQQRFHAAFARSSCTVRPSVSHELKGRLAVRRLWPALAHPGSKSGRANKHQSRGSRQNR